MQDNMGLMIQKMTWGSHGDIEKLCCECLPFLYKDFTINELLYILWNSIWRNDFKKWGIKNGQNN